MDQANTIIVVLLGAIALGASLYRGARWIVKTLDLLTRLSKETHGEVKHNGGASMRDEVSGLGRAVRALDDRLGELTSKLGRMELDKDTTHTAQWQAITHTNEKIGDLTTSLRNVVERLAHVAAAEPGGRREYDPPPLDPDDEFPT